MIKIIERKNGSMIFAGFYDKESSPEEIEGFKIALKSLCVDSHKDRAIAIPEGTELEILRLDEK
jgi:hypothetical protein